MTLSFSYGKCSKIVSAQYHVKKTGANRADSDQDALHSLLCDDELLVWYCIISIWKEIILMILKKTLQNLADHKKHADPESFAEGVQIW